MKELSVCSFAHLCSTECVRLCETLRSCSEGEATPAGILPSGFPLRGDASEVEKECNASEAASV